MRNLRAPTKADAGSKPPGSAGADQPASLPDLLAKTVPIGLVTAYGAFIAAISELVSPTASDPDPDQLVWIRWVGFAILVATAIGMTLASYSKKAPGANRSPIIEVAAVAVAAIGWGLGIPESPVLATITSKTTGIAVLALVAFVGLAINLVLAKLMQTPASTST